MTKIKESALREMIKESLKKVLSEGTTNELAIERWEQVKEQIGADQMLDCIFGWVSSDQIDQWLGWFEEEEWVTFDNNDMDNNEGF